MEPPAGSAARLRRSRDDAAAHSALRQPESWQYAYPLRGPARYLETLAWPRDVVKLHTVFGGKNPHPNFVVGGVPSPIDLNSDSAINAERLSIVQNIIDVEDVRGPSSWRASTRIGALASKALAIFLMFGDLPAKSMNEPESFLFPRGAILNRNLSVLEEVDFSDPNGVQEFASHSCMSIRVESHRACILGQRDETELRGSWRSAAPVQAAQRRARLQLSEVAALKGPLDEAGSLARVLALYTSGHGQTGELLNYTLKTRDVPVEALFSRLGRTAARTLETKVVADATQGWMDPLLSNIRVGDTKTFNEVNGAPSSCPGGSPGRERPRGATRWAVAPDRHQGRSGRQLPCVIPSRWNAGPHDPQGHSWRLRGCTAARPPVLRPRATDRDPADHPQLRSLPRLRRACRG